MFSAIPFLNQYWHPYCLGGKASGTVEYGGESWSFDGAKLYAERNWGAGFPLRWWWGQAHDFGVDDVCVASPEVCCHSVRSLVTSTAWWCGWATRSSA